jgi:hypothetical protein
LESSTKDESSVKHPKRRRRQGFDPPSEIVNDNPEAKKELIRSYASIIVEILLSNESHENDYQS